MEREAVLVGIDVGTSKVCTLIGEVSRDGRLTIMGHGTVPSSGLKKGVVVNQYTRKLPPTTVPVRARFAYASIASRSSMVR